MFNRVLQWLCDALGPEKDSNGDVTIDEAIMNYQKYQEELNERLDKYIKTVCSKIKTESRNGYKYIRVDDLPKEFDCSECIQKNKSVFRKPWFYCYD